MSSEASQSLTLNELIEVQREAEEVRLMIEDEYEGCVKELGMTNERLNSLERLFSRG